jgi:anti-sigma regulatory factor (Ser/Thr protein kinase)
LIRIECQLEGQRIRWCASDIGVFDVVIVVPGAGVAIKEEWLDEKAIS